MTRAGVLGKEELTIMSNQILSKTKNLVMLKFLGGAGVVVVEWGTF